MNKIKIISTVLIFLLLIVFTQSVYATSTSITTIMGQAKDWVTQGKQDAQDIGTIDTSNVQEVSKVIFNTLFVIAIVIAVIVGAILGIKFMTAGIDKKVEVKEALVPYIISCVVVFGAMGIWKVCVTILGSL